MVKILTSMAERIESMSTPEPNTGCWLWTAATRSGYGHIRVGGKSIGAHRASFMAYVGPIPDGHVVRHTCDNPPCVNPAHLTTGTQADNINDAVVKRRMRHGKTATSVRLTEDQVMEIRARRETGATARGLAAKFNVAVNTVYLAENGTNWRYLNG